jgi:SAM-dependent methyltransferase
MLASISLPAQAAAKKPAPAAAKKAAAPATGLHKVEVLRWSFDKWIPGLFCTKVDEPIDPHGWDDNFLCSTRDLGLRWSSLGPINGMVCTQIDEGSDPDGWGDNYLCAPQDYGFKWSMKGVLKGMQCLPITEPYDPHTWKDNFLCWPPAGVLNAVVSPPENPTDVVNLIRARHDYQSYLEIGQGAKDETFDSIGCKIKIGVDPDRRSNASFQIPYDEFFAQNTLTFDLIFINGLHEANQVEKALANAMKVLKPGGTIVMHNLNPIAPGQQTVPQPAGQDAWKGDVWKAWVKLGAAHDDLDMHVINFDTGIGIITRGKQSKLKLPAELTYQALDANRKEWLKLIELNAFLKDLDVQ